MNRGSRETVKLLAKAVEVIDDHRDGPADA
jgi:hypothetical protein